MPLSPGDKLGPNSIGRQRSDGPGAAVLKIVFNWRVP